MDDEEKDCGKIGYVAGKAWACELEEGHDGPCKGKMLEEDEVY